MSKYETFYFTNIDTEPFIGRYGGEDYPLNPGETKVFPDFLVKHFCKHLADKILNREDKSENEVERNELIAQMKQGGLTPVQPNLQPKKTEGQEIKTEVEKIQEDLRTKMIKSAAEVQAKRVAALTKARKAKKQKAELIK